MEVTSIKPIEYMIENSVLIRVESGKMIDFDGKVCFHNENNNMILSAIDKGLLSAALHKNVPAEEMKEIEKKIADFSTKNGSVEQIDGNFVVIINSKLATEKAFYIEEDSFGAIKFDRTLVCTDSPFDSIQKMLGINVVRKIEK